MRNHHSRKILTSSVVYTMGNGIEALTPFLLAVILTRKLSPGEYGVWVLFVALVTFLRPLTSLNIQDALRMRYFEMDRPALAEFVLSSFYIVTATTFLFFIASIVGRDPLSLWLKFPEAWLAAIVLGAYLYSIFYFIQAFYQFEDNKIRFVMLHVIQSSLSIGIAVTLVFSGWDWRGAVVGKLSGLLSVSLFAGMGLVRELQLTLKSRFYPHAKELAKFGLHYLPTGLSLVIIPLTDRLVISHVLGLDQNGLYGVAALFGSAFFIIVNGFLLAWMPWLFMKLARREDRYKAEIRRLSASFVLLLPVVALGFYLFSMQIAPFIIGTSFHGAFGFVPWAIAVFVIQGYFFHNQAFLLFKKAVVMMSLSSTLGVVLNVILSYVWALSYGVKGVIIATIVSYSLSALLSGTFGFHVYRTLNGASNV